MMEKLASDVAIRRRRDGLFFQGKTNSWAEKPRFLPTLTRAQAVVRIDLGEDLAEFDFPMRFQLEGFSP